MPGVKKAGDYMINLWKDSLKGGRTKTFITLPLDAAEKV